MEGDGLRWARASVLERADRQAGDRPVAGREQVGAREEVGGRARAAGHFGFLRA